MDPRILVTGLFCLIGTGVANADSFSDFQLALDKAAEDLSSIDKESGDKFKESVGLPADPQEPPTTTTTAAPPVPCGGWFQPACTTAKPTEPPATPAPAKPAEPEAPAACGGWFQPACTTPEPTEPPTTPAPVLAAEPEERAACGGWFQPACETTTTPQPQPEATPPTTPPQTTAPPACGGWFQPACTTTTTPPPKSRSWGLFGNFKKPPSTTEAPSSGGWLSGIVSTFKETAGKAVGTALDVSSKIATASLNGGIDFFLAEIKLLVQTTNMDVVPLPDIQVPLYPGASLEASGGYFKSVSAISRGGDIVVSRDGLAFIIDFPVEIKDLEIGYKNYSITVLMGMGTSGSINVGVGENRINIRIRLAVSTSCAINLEKVDFAVLDDLDINMTYGCSYCGFITDKATTYLTNFFKNTIRLQIQSQIDSILKKTLSENSLICSKFMGG